MVTTESNCKPGSRCGHFRTCDPCARLRQAHFADIAQQLLGQKALLYLTRLTPHINTQEEIKRLKIAVKRRLSAANAVWSVEQGTKTGSLHLNVISEINSIKSHRGADQYISGAITNLRNAAAYITKQSQLPNKEAYSGRQFGCFTSVFGALIDYYHTPILQAAIMENAVLNAMVLPTPYLERQKEIEEVKGTKEHYKSIAMRHLPRLQAALDALKPSNKPTKIN